MKPITFSCAEILGISSDEIARQILDVARWPDFKGFGVLPGIKAAEFEIETPEIVGSRIKSSIRTDRVMSKKSWNGKQTAG